MTSNEIISEVAGPLHYNEDNTTHAARIIRWCNLAQLDMMEHDWGELITYNDSFTTDGSSPYDLTATANFGTTFLRLIDKSVRIGAIPIELRDKSFYDMYDPNRSISGTAYWGYLKKRKEFYLFPEQSSGVTVYCDWVGLPTTFAADMDESDVSFDTDRHDLIVEGAIWRGKRFVGLSDWLQSKQLFEYDLKKTYQISHRVHYKKSLITENNF